jgi:two-component system chemotaxis response regulator CheY
MGEVTNGFAGAIALPAVLDQAAAEGFLGMLLRAAEAESATQLDGTVVETITTPCIQILLAAARADDRLTVVNPSEAMVSAFRDLGLSLPGAPVEMPADEVARASEVVSEVVSEAVSEEIHFTADTETMAKRILTIDDSKTMRDMLMLTLSDAGYEVIQAVDGQDGINVLGDKRVDVVITDINMPKMDGYAVIRNLRANPIHKSTPILVLTTESDTEKKNLARDAGATGWMVKPFDPDQLVATIRKVSP